MGSRDGGVNEDLAAKLEAAEGRQAARPVVFLTISRGRWRRFPGVSAGRRDAG